MKKVIFHVDVNSAFLSWEAVDRLQKGETTDLRTIPSAVCGDPKKRRGVILARSVPAKQYGVTTGEPVMTALKKVPLLNIGSAESPVVRAVLRGAFGVFKGSLSRGRAF
ncbi:MAG: hypothetical protein ACOX3Q_08405 [Clostridia bacterium]